MEEIVREINQLRKDKNAVILAHNYQIGEIQDLADYVGDSLGLSQQAAKTEKDLIVFCGVYFMAETASIISPQKRVLIPRPDAGCSLASSITAEQLIKWKEQFPDAVVVSYVNTTASIKAESDYCVTSSNAVQIVNKIPVGKKILFLPDKFLGNYVEAMTGRKMEIWNGSCHVHEKIGDVNFEKARAEHPGADFLIHPECGCSSSCMLKSKVYFDCKDVHIYSTEGMIDHVRDSDSKEFVIATEVDILHRLRKLKPEATFFPLSENALCEYMKTINLENLRDALLYDKYEVKVPREIAERAIVPIERMLQIS